MMMLDDDRLSKLASLKDALRSPPFKAPLKGCRRITKGAWLPPLFIRPNQFNHPIFPDYSIIYRDENLGDSVTSVASFWLALAFPRIPRGPGASSFISALDAWNRTMAMGD